MKQDQITLLAFGAAVVLIGSNLVAIRFSNREIEPFWGAGTRFALAAALFYAALLVNRLALPRGRALIGAVLYGAVGIALYFAFIYWGLVDVQAGYGQVLLSLTPLLTLLLATGQGLEGFRWRGLIGAVIATAGVSVLFREQVRADVAFLSVLAIVIAAVCAAQGGIVLKRFPPVNLIATNTIAMSVGAVCLLMLSVLSGEEQRVPVQMNTWVAFVYLATLGTLGTFMLYMYVLRHWTASAASYQFVLAPVVALVLAAVLLEEGVSAGFALGGVLVLAGVYVGALAPAHMGGQVAGSQA